MNDPRLWFGPKRLGIGWSPRTWEGWAMISAFVVVLFSLKWAGVIG